MLHAFLDESGTNQETPVLSVAGFYGRNEQWEVFQDRWNQPSTLAFHAKRSTDQFSDLCAAIEKSGVRGVLLTVGKATYGAMATPHLKTAVGNPYSLCAFLCAMQIGKEAGHEPVSFVIEQGQPNAPFVKRILESMIAAGEFNIAAVATAKKADFLQLHAADFLSHIASTHDMEWMKRIFESKLVNHGHVTEEMIRTTNPQVTELFRKARFERKKQRGQQ